MGLTKRGLTGNIALFLYEHDKISLFMYALEEMHLNNTYFISRLTDGYFPVSWCIHTPVQTLVFACSLKKP